MGDINKSMGVMDVPVPGQSKRMRKSSTRWSQEDESNNEQFFTADLYYVMFY